jgi:hypothetical protein
MGKDDLTGYKSMTAEVTRMEQEPSYARPFFFSYNLLVAAADHFFHRTADADSVDAYGAHRLSLSGKINLVAVP